MAYEKDWSASAELNGMRKNPLFNRLRAQSTIDTGRYGNLVQDVANYSKMSRGRESLNKFGNAQKGLYVPGDNIGPAVNRRTAAATGSNADWAWPKLHDPFEWFRERCILPGEMMNLRDGRKRVEDVVVGDIALTHKGRYRKVIGLGHKSYEGKAYSVEPYYLSKAKVTEDHPFWAKKNLSDEPDWIKVQHLSKKDWVFIPVDREVGDVDTINILDHLDADDWVVEDGYIAYKKNDVHYRTRSLGNQVSVKFEVSDEFLWLLGLYLAEGYSNDKSISWYISNQEFYIKDRIIDSCKQLFNIDARYSENKNDNTFNVCLTAQPLATLFHKWCGKNAHDKHLPEWVMYLPIEKQRVILEGILDGDGCYQDDKIYFLSVSPQFTEQVRRLMLRCGYFPSISHRSKKDFKTQIKIEGTNTALILLGNDQYKFLNDINAIANDGFVYNKRLTGRYKPINRKQRFVTHQEKNGVWVQIRDIEKFDYKGEIYYFTVDEDHSFTISDQGVRNTWWFNMEDPDEQTRKIRDWSASPDSLVLMGDYTWKRIGDISEGEEVIGWESYTTKNSTKQRLTKTKVVAIKHRIAPNTVKVTMSSGRTMIVTDDHMWANYNYSPAVTSRVNRQRNVIKEQENQRISAGELFNIGFTSGQVARKMGIKVSTAEKWHAIWVKEGMDGLKSSINYMDASELKSAEYVTSHVGAELKFVATPPRQLITDEEKFAAGYIAAMIDGEGFIDKTTVSITQSPTINPDICKKIEECLDILGIPYKLRVETKGKNSFSEGKIINRYYFQGTPNAHGTRQAVLDLHNMTNKGSVKINRHIDKMFLTANFGSKETVVDVEPLGEGPVVSMQTGTGNYIQDGYASKNCRLIYTTHYLVPSMIDIYSRFPLLGMEFAHPDKRVNEFFSELFWDGLQYQDFLYSLSREHWLIGDAFALGSWNDGIGAWEADELINPNDVVVAKNRALRTYQYHIKVPEEVKKLVETRQPEKEYAMLMAMYPDVVEYARKDVEIPVSDVIMKGLPYKCLVAKTDILTPSGPRPVEDLQVGDPVIAWDSTSDTPVTSYVEHNAVQSARPVVTVTTKKGRTLTCTLDHPFLTPTGMVNAIDLLPGDKVRIGESIDLKSKEVPTDLAYFLGLMVGDGSYYPHCFEFHNEEEILIDWVEKFVKKYGCDLHKKFKSSFAIVNDGANGKTKFATGSNNLRNLFRDLGIFGQKCHQKRIPQLIWEGSEEAKWAFLSGYLDSDGCLVRRTDFKSKKIYYAYDWSSYNQKLLDDTQLLLSVLGVPTTRRLHHIKVESYQGVERLRENLTPLLPRKQLENMWDQQVVIPSLKEWDTIKEVKMAGEQETYALCIAGVHTHVSAGLVTKNTNPWAEHGTPILMRAFRQLMMEESLQASMEAISDRLYSPLILATLGLPDADQDGPWIPDAEELGALRDDLAMAINADFRLMVYHHGLQIQNAFGRESMPRLDQDFYRIQANYMMVFGIGSELLQGGKSGATYASGALNRELITQMLTTHQHQIKHFIQGRMRAVAERQGFYEYRNVGGHPVPVMETVLVVDEETGAQFVEERPKLAIPDIIFQSMSLQDENVEHAFLQQLAGMGFPISFQTFTRNVGIDFEDEVETRKKEKVDLVVAEQQLKKDIFDRCFQLQLPIPMEYQAEYEAYIMQLQDPQLAEQIRPGAINDITSMTPTPNISGTPVHVDAGGIPDMYPSIANQETLKQRQHPVESHEQKKTEPKRSKGGPKNGPQKKTASLADIDLEEDDILVISRRTNEPIVFEDGSIISNLGAEGKEWGSYRKHNPKKASVTEEVQNDKVVTYSDSLKLSVPWESQYRVQMKLANGQRVVVDNEYEKYDEVYMKDHIAKILESNVDSSEDDSFDDRLNEQIIPTRMDFGEHHPGMMGFDERAIVGVPTEDMGPKVTFGAVEFPNRKNLNNNKDVIEHKD